MMAQFSVSDAAFTGFGVVRHKPRAVAVWVIVQIIISLATTTLMLTRFGPLMAKITSMSATQSQDPAQAVAMLRQMAPLYGVFLVFSLIFYPILFATMNRAVLRPGDDGFGYIRIGADEFRQLGLMLIFIGLGVVAEIVLVIVGIIVGAGIGAVLHQAAVAGLAVAVAVLCGFVYLGVRLSLASAQTFATRKISVFGSWALTKGRFWPIFGVYVLATALLLIVSLLGYVVIFAVVAAVGGGGDIMSAVMHPEAASAAGLFSPARIVQLVLTAALGAITWPIMTTPAPAIYRAIVGDGASPADVF
jgi:hypothetical protein